MINTVSLLIDMDYVKSKSEFLRLVKQGGVQLNGEKIVENTLYIVIKNEDVSKRNVCYILIFSIIVLDIFFSCHYNAIPASYEAY